MNQQTIGHTRLSVLDAAEMMEWMKDSPIDAVWQYLRNKGYSHEELQHAYQLFLIGRN